MATNASYGQTTTLDPDSEPQGTSDPESVVALTILYHPDLSRVGQQALLITLRGGRSARLSRLVPKFGIPGQAARTPLNDGHVSRQPLFIESAAGGGLVLNADGERSRIMLDGVKVAGTHRVSAAELAAGVVLELSGCVSLLLHRTQPHGEASKDHLGIIGEAAAIRQLRARIRRVAPHPVAVLIRGESGVGKELVAAALHKLSPRAEQPLVNVNMAAVPPAMAASALFGHAQGAFTGAVASTRGYFGRADGGTLFLDEVGDTPSNVQPQLLRVLENGEVQPIGAQQTEKVDVRLIAATDVDLEEAIDKGAFRQALLQRLGSYVLDVPSLRARREDIARLFIYFLADELGRLSRQQCLAEPPPGGRPWLPCWLMTAAVRHRWPGNVRELRNAARQIAIDWADAPEVLRDPAIEQLFPVNETARGRAAATRPSLEQITDDLLLTTLKKHKWRPAPAAADLGISRTSIYALMRKSPQLRMAGELPADEITQALEACAGSTSRAAMQLMVSQPGLKRRMHQLGLSHGSS